MMSDAIENSYRKNAVQSYLHRAFGIPDGRVLMDTLQAHPKLFYPDAHLFI